MELKITNDNFLRVKRSGNIVELLLLYFLIRFDALTVLLDDTGIDGIVLIERESLVMGGWFSIAWHEILWVMQILSTNWRFNHFITLD